jgi:hypothetical protein
MLPLTSAFSSVRDLAGRRRLSSPRSWGAPPAGAPVRLAVGTVVRFRARTETNGAFLLGGVRLGLPYRRPHMLIDPDCDRTSLSRGSWAASRSQDAHSASATARATHRTSTAPTGAPRVADHVSRETLADVEDRIFPTIQQSQHSRGCLANESEGGAQRVGAKSVPGPRERRGHLTCGDEERPWPAGVRNVPGGWERGRYLARGDEKRPWPMGVRKVADPGARGRHLARRGEKRPWPMGARKVPGPRE